MKQISFLKRSMLRGTILGLSLYGNSVTAANILFKENFESGLSAWTGKDEGPHHGKLVKDPLNDKNQVLTFTALNSGGDIFSKVINNPSGKYILSFDYLGLTQGGSIPDDFGGFIGYSYDTPGSHTWIAGTMASYPGIVYHLEDIGQWTRIFLTFTAGSEIRIMLEDYIGSGGIPGDAYFDNIVLTDDDPLLATLDKFAATSSSDGILIHWRTLAELDSAGFNLWRAKAPQEGQCQGKIPAQYIEIVKLNNKLIPAIGTLYQGAPYSYRDTTVVSGMNYCYGLEELDYNGFSTVYWDSIISAHAQ